MRAFTLKLILLNLIWALFGCRQEGFSSSTSSTGAPPCVPGSCTITTTANKSGQQSIPFEFDFNSSVSGPIYYVANKPSWMTVDAVGTKIIGVPTTPVVLRNLKISIYDGVQTEEIGPFDLSISGDPLVPYAWHLKNTGQTSFSSSAGVSGEDVNLLGALTLAVSGLGVRVAVSDCGMELNHEDLTQNISAGQSRNYSLASPYTGDPNPGTCGHGTSVAGLIAAKGWNGIGSRGVAPNAGLAGFNYITSTISLATALNQATGNFDIFNYSYGTAQCTVTPINGLYLAQLKSGVTTLRAGKGALYIKSAGNDFSSDLADCYSIPSGVSPFFGNANFDGEDSTPYTILVSASNANSVFSSYSSPGSNIWIAAPGGEYGNSAPAMVTTDMETCSAGYALTGSTRNSFEASGTLNPGCNYTSAMNGTSSAAPVTSGVVALMLEANPALTWRDVKHILAVTAKKINPTATSTNHPRGLNLSGHVYQYGWTTNQAGYNFHNRYGFGRVDASAAVAAAQSYATVLGGFIETANPVTDDWYYSSGGVTLSIPDNSAAGRTSIVRVRHSLVIEAVQVRVNITHSIVSDLGLMLTSPSGTKSILATINSGNIDTDFVDAIFLTNAFYGEPSTGNWTLKVVDGYSADMGTLDSWDIKVFGHVDPAPTDVSVPSAVTGLTVPTPLSSLTSTPAVTWTASGSTDVNRYEVSVGTTAGATNILPWVSVGSAVTSTQTLATPLTDETTYYFNVRVIDTSENASPVVTGSWYANVP